MEYVNNAWSSKLLQDELATAQFIIDEDEFREAISNGAYCVIGHPDTAKMFGVESNRQTLTLHPGDVIYVCELNMGDVPPGTRLPEGITRVKDLPKGSYYRFLKIVVHEIPNEWYFE